MAWLTTDRLRLLRSRPAQAGALGGALVIAAAIFALCSRGGSDGAPGFFTGGHLDDVTAIALSADGRLLASGGTNGKLTVWDTSTRQVLRGINEHTRAVRGVAFSPKGERLLSAGWDKQAILFDARSGHLLWRTPGAYSLTAGEFSPIGDVALVGNTQGQLLALDSANGKQVAALGGHRFDIASIAFSRDGRFAISGSGDRTAKIWNMTDGKLVRTLPEQEGIVTAVDLSADGGKALTGDQYGRIAVWKAADGSPVMQATTLGRITDACFSPDGALLLVSTAAPGKAEIRDADSGEIEASVPFDGADARAAAFSPDGERYFVAVARRIVELRTP